MYVMFYASLTRTVSYAVSSQGLLLRAGACDLVALFDQQEEILCPLLRCCAAASYAASYQGSPGRQDVPVVGRTPLAWLGRQSSRSGIVRIYKIAPSIGICSTNASSFALETRPFHFEI